MIIVGLWHKNNEILSGDLISPNIWPLKTIYYVSYIYTGQNLPGNPTVISPLPWFTSWWTSCLTWWRSTYTQWSRSSQNISLYLSHDNILSITHEHSSEFSENSNDDINNVNSIPLIERNPIFPDWEKFNFPQYYTWT